MGFFDKEIKLQKRERELENPSELSIEYLHKAECDACPLQREYGANIKPTGPEDALLYFIGEAPGENEARKQAQFVGASGQVLRSRIPEDWERDIRWNNVVRTRPPENRTPTRTEIECCRPSIVRDIERVKPRAIVGFGNVALEWALEQTGVTKWQGRRAPVTIGNHTCWYYAMVHPSAILQGKEEEELAFTLALQEMFNEVENLPEPIVHTREDAERGIECVTGAHGWADVKKVKDFLRSCDGVPAVGYDYETNAEAPFEKRARILTVAVSKTFEETMAIAVKHRETQWTPEQLSAVFDAIEDFLYETRCRKVSHSLPFELDWTIEFFGGDAVYAQGWEDTMSQAYILDERIGMLSLDALCIQYFGLSIKSLSSHLDVANLDDEPLEDVLVYNAIDAKYHKAVFLEQEERLHDEGLMHVYEQQLNRIPALSLMRARGVPIDQERVRALLLDYDKREQAVRDEIAAHPLADKFFKATGKRFQPSKNQHVRDALRMDKVKIDKSVDAEVLESIDHPLARLVVKFRKIRKNKSTYIEPYWDDPENEEKSCVWEDGLVHPKTNTCSTRTWRTSSDDPNIQNQPKRNEAAKEVRAQVKPRRKRQRVVSLDYSGMQARNVAMESLDPRLVKYFWEDYDIHRDWTERLLRIVPDWDKGGKLLAKDDTEFKRARNVVKNKFVFPSFFGAGVPNISNGLKIEEADGRELQEAFWDEFPIVRKWQKRTIERYQEVGYVEAICGFRRRAPIAVTQIINSPIQADEAAIVCDAMARLSRLDWRNLQCNMEIHDDLTWIWDVDDIERNAEIAIKEMIKPTFDWVKTVPLEVELSIGTDWSNQKAVGKFTYDKWNGTLRLAQDI